MATRYCFSAPILVQKLGYSRTRPFKGGILMMSTARDHQASSFQLKSSLKEKVFEDKSAGIVCYRDENGEITCEGYDEGPRLHQPPSTLTCNPRDVEIVDLLQKCWVLVCDEECNEAEKALKDVGCNGFNTFC